MLLDLITDVGRAAAALLSAHLTGVAAEAGRMSRLANSGGHRLARRGAGRQ